MSDKMKDKHTPAPSKDYKSDYSKFGFSTDIEEDRLPKGLTEDTVRQISAKKDEPLWMTEWRLKALQKWKEKELPEWAHLNVPAIDFQEITYFSSPKNMNNAPKSMDEVDPKLLE